MADQLDFEFAERRAARFPADHPLVIFRWLSELNKLEAYWPDFQTTSWFRTWREALPIVLHDLNGHVQVKVRV